MTFNPLVLTDAYISINANVLSDHGNKVSFDVTIEDLDATTFGQTWHVRRGGLADGTLNITFVDDYAAANLDSLIWPLIGTVVPFEIRPTSAARSTANPAYTGSILINKWVGLGGDIGKLAAVDVAWPTSGTVLRQTA